MHPNQQSQHPERFDDDAVIADGGGAAPAIAGLARRHKWLLLAGACLGLVGGELLYLKLGPAYLATARILVSKRTSVPLHKEGEADAYGERGEHIALIMSPMIVEQAVKSHALDQLQSLRLAAEPVQEVVETLKVKRTAGSDRSALNVLELTFESPVRGDAPTIVNGVVGAYQDYLEKSRQQYTREMLDLITQASDKVFKDLENHEREYMEFRAHAPLHWRGVPGAEGIPGDGTNVHQERVTAIETERRTNLLRRAEISSQLKAIEKAREDGESDESLQLIVRLFTYGTVLSSLTSGESNESLQLVVRQLMNNESIGGAGRSPMAAAAAAAGIAPGQVAERLLPLLLEEQKLLRDYGPDHPQVKAVRASLEATRDFYRQQGLLPPAPGESDDKSSDQAPAAPVNLVDVYVASLRQQLHALEFREQELTTIFETESKQAKDLSGFQLEDHTRIAEIKRLRTLSEQITNRLSETDVLKDSGGYDLRLVAPPREELSQKRKAKFLGGGTTLGLLAAFGLVYLRALRDVTLKSIVEIQNSLGLSILGRLPQLEIDGAAKRDASRFDLSLVYHYQSESLAAEAFRTLRTALFVSTHAHGRKVLQVTSPEPHDGKTTTACNLALSMAQAAKNVLIIDADLRCPRVSALLGLRKGPGLSDVLAGDIELVNAIQPTEEPHVSVLGAGLATSNPAEILSSPRFAQVIAELRNQYDFVLIDSPPLLAVTDACVVASNADGLLLVVQLEKTSRDSAIHATERAATTGAHILGVVVTGASPGDCTGEGYGYEAYYGPRERNREKKAEPAACS